MPGDKSNTNFRKILLNKCQREFEKEKQDDIQMEKDRSKTFETVWNMIFLQLLCWHRECHKRTFDMHNLIYTFSFQKYNFWYDLNFLVCHFQEKERKEWKEELDYREMINRRRTLGNIRFIGELFKLKVSCWS